MMKQKFFLDSFDDDDLKIVESIHQSVEEVDQETKNRIKANVMQSISNLKSAGEFKLKRKKVLMAVASVFIALTFLTGFTFAVSPDFRAYMAEIFNITAVQNTSGLSFEIDKVKINSNSGQVSFSIKSITEDKIQNNFRFKSIQIFDQQDRAITYVNDYEVSYNPTTDETDVVFRCKDISQNLGRKLSLRIVDLYHVQNIVDPNIKIPLNEIVLNGSTDGSCIYQTGDKVIEKVGLIFNQMDIKNDIQMSKLLYESTSTALSNKSVVFEVIDKKGMTFSKEEIEHTNVQKYVNYNETSGVSRSSTTSMEGNNTASHASISSSTTHSPYSIKTGGSITFPANQDLSNYYLTFEYADIIPYKSGTWEIFFIPTKDMDDYKYEKQLNQTVKIQDSKNSSGITDITFEKAEFTTTQTIITARLKKEFVNSQHFEILLNQIRIKTAFTQYSLIKSVNLTQDEQAEYITVALVFPTVTGDRDPVLVLTENYSTYKNNVVSRVYDKNGIIPQTYQMPEIYHMPEILLDTTYEYIRFRQAIGYGTKLTMDQVWGRINKLEIRELISELESSNWNSITSSDQYGTFSVSELYDGTEIYIYNDTYDKIAAYHPKTQKYEIIYDPSKMEKPPGMSHEEWLSKKTVDENEIRSFVLPFSLDQVEQKFGEPNQKTDSHQGKTYLYRANSGFEFIYRDNGVRFECWVGDFYNIFSKPSSEITLKKLSITKKIPSDNLRNARFDDDLFYYGAPCENIIKQFGQPDATQGESLYYKLAGNANYDRYAILVCDSSKNLIEIYLREDRSDGIQLSYHNLPSKKSPDQIPSQKKHELSEIKALKYVRTIQDVRDILGTPFYSYEEAVSVIKYQLTDGQTVSFWSNGTEINCEIEAPVSGSRSNYLFYRDCTTGFEKYNYTSSKEQFK